MNTDKILKLIKLVDKSVKLENLRRLVDGDLSHIGDALIEGKKIKYGSFPYAEPMTFSGAASGYTIIEPRITIGNVSFPAPESVAPKQRAQYWLVDFNFTDCVDDYEWTGDDIDLRILKSGVLHLTRESALEHAEALVKISKGEF